MPAPMRRRTLRVQASALVGWVVFVAWQAVGIAGGEPLTDVLADLAWVALWFVLDVGLGLGRAARRGAPRSRPCTSGRRSASAPCR